MVQGPAKLPAHLIDKRTVHIAEWFFEFFDHEIIVVRRVFLVLGRIIVEVWPSIIFLSSIVRNQCSKTYLSTFLTSSRFEKSLSSAILSGSLDRKDSL